ncbi:MAG: DUF3341 domain-containing protein [Acidobacteria bacterium]|nr:DUF3341 domain-containing protein [Acidobacteriota bacterium]
MASTEFLHGTRLRAAFDSPEGILAAVRALRAEGHRVLDTYTPFPVHGMDEAMELRPSRLPRACLGFGLLGLALAVALQVWTSAFDYPLRVGGKPLAAIPAFIPVTFELTVLLAGLGVVASLFVVAGLRPRFRVPDLHPGANDDRFVLACEVLAGSNPEDVATRLEGMGATGVALLVDDRLARADSFWERKAGPGIYLLAALPAAAVLGLLALLNRDYHFRNLSWDGGMGAQVSAASFDASGVLPGGTVLQPPPRGTVPRDGLAPLGFGPGKEEAARAGRELQNPFQPTQANFNRGRQVYERACAACHGKDGDNNAPIVTERKAFSPSILVSKKVVDQPDGYLFHVATFGGPEKMRGLGDLIGREDRWKVVLYLRELQKAAAPRPPSPPAAPPAAPAPGAKP